MLPCVDPLFHVYTHCYTYSNALSSWSRKCTEIFTCWPLCIICSDNLS